MGKKRRILIAALLVVLLCGFGWWLLRPREPSYQGKSLSAWLDDYSRDDGLSNTDEAVRHIGTNAIPMLLQMLRAHDSQLKKKCIELLGRQHFMTIKISTSEDKNAMATIAFEALGPQGANAVTQLTKIYDESSDNQWAAASCIASIGPPAKSAIPSLLTGLKSREVSVRGATIWALGRIHGEPQLVVPELTKILHDSKAIFRQSAVGALGKFGTNASSAFPDMIALRNDPGMGIIVSNALKQIDPEAAAKAGVK